MSQNHYNDAAEISHSELERNRPVVSIEEKSLHSHECAGGHADIAAMREILERHDYMIDWIQLLTPTDEHTRTLPLHHAVRANHIDCTLFLLNRGANPDIWDNTGHTALELAIESSLSTMVKTLLDHGASPNYPPHKNFHTRTKYLELAVDKRENDIVKMLLEYGADTEDYEINTQGVRRLKVNWESPLINALWEENTYVFKLLLFHSSFLECYDDNNSIPHIIIASYIPAMEAINALKVYKEFGGNLWVLQPDLKDRTEEKETALQSLRRTPCPYQFKGEPANVDVELEHLMQTPLSLQSLCRIVIHKTIGRNYWKRVSSLPLPTQIINFLKYYDVFQVEDI